MEATITDRRKFIPNIEITLEQSLLLQLEELANSLQISADDAVIMALEQLIKRTQNEETTRRINEAYPEVRDEEELKEEQAWLRFGQRSILKVIDKW